MLKKIDPQTALWIQNDLALAIYKTGDFQKCLDIIETIEDNPNFSHASPALKKAVAFNKQNCVLSMKKPGQLDKSKGDKEYSWLLNKNLSDSEKQNLFKMLIAQACPGGTPGDVMGIPCLENSFSSELAARSYPPEIKDRRYGIASDCIPHDAAIRGIIWVDIHDGTSVVGFIDGEIVYLTSKFYNSKSIPSKAKRDIKEIAAGVFKEWNKDPEKMTVYFHNVENSNGTVDTLPFNWLNG